MFGLIKLFIQEEFFVLSLPKTLTLRNRRLGMLYRSMQVMMLGIIIAYLVQTEVGLIRHNVQPWGVSLLIDSVTAAKGMEPSYCLNPTAYVHTRQSDHQRFSPSSCTVLEDYETHSVENSELLIHSFIQDTKVWEEFGDACVEQVAPSCEQNFTNSKFESEKSGGDGCSCTFTEEFLVSRPEEQRIILFHGFQVDYSGGKGEQVFHGGIGYSNSDNARYVDILTIFQRKDGHVCEVGGRLRWSSNDATHGIHMTLGELLACADVSLDMPPHLRTMGLAIQLRLDYKESLAGHITCQIVVETADRSAVAPYSSDFIRLPSGNGARRIRRPHSVAINAVVQGQLNSFDWPSAVKGIVDVAVLLTVPSTLVGMVALYGMGLISEVYRHAQRTRLSIFAMYHTAAAKFMLAEVAFRGLVGGVWQGNAASLHGLTPLMLYRHIKEVFQEHVADGTLQEEELYRMTAVIFRGMDPNNVGTISCNQFIHAVTDDGDMDIRKMAQMFGDDSEEKNQSLGTKMARRFDSTYDKRAMAASVMPRLRSFDRTELNADDGFASDSDEAFAADDTKHVEDAGLELRLAALEEQGRRMEDRVNALESNQECPAAVEAKALACNDVTSSITKTMESMHFELQTMRSHVENRLEELKQEVRMLDQQVKQHNYNSSYGSELEQPQASNRLEPDQQVESFAVGEFRSVCDDAVGMESMESMQSISSDMPPMPQTPRMPGGVSRNLLASMSVLRTKKEPSSLSVHPSSQYTDASATKHGLYGNEVAVLVEANCTEIPQKPRPQQRRKMSAPLTPALTDPSPRLVQPWRSGPSRI